MNAKELIRKASPVILTALAIFGVGATAYSAVKASKEVDEDLASKKREFTNEHGYIYEYKIEPKEKAMVYISHYYKPVLFGVGTVMCILGANKLSTRNQALLTSAYALLERTHTEYVDKVKDIFGVEGHNKVMDAIALSPCVKKYIDNPSSVTHHYQEVELEETNHLFFDQFSRRYFESTMSAVLQAEYAANRNYTIAGILSINDFYEFLGLEPVDLGDDYLWYFDDGITWIDFDHHTFTTEDGTIAVSIDMPYGPVLRWDKDE